MNLHELFILAREHITDPDMWIKGAYSHNDLKGAIDGEPCCLTGAIIWADEGQFRLESEAKLYLCRLTPFGGPAYFNDHPSTTHVDILDLLDTAISNTQPEDHTP